MDNIYKKKCVTTVYKTVNTINGKIYIGVHRTKNPMDDYLGSGFLLKKAIIKYGKNNFKKEILFEFDNDSEAYENEREIVTKQLIESGTTYNLKIGGDGGWDYATKKAISGRFRISNETLQQTKLINKNDLKKYEKENWFRGILKSTKEKIKINHADVSGEKNGAFNTLRMYNPLNNEQIMVEVNNTNKYLDEGWIFGISDESKNNMKLSRNSGFSKKFHEENQKGENSKFFGSKWMKKDNKDFRVPKNNIHEFLEKGWEFGRIGWAKNSF